MISNNILKSTPTTTSDFELNMKKQGLQQHYVRRLQLFSEGFFVALFIPFSTDPGVSKHSVTCHRGVWTNSKEKGIWQLGQHPSWMGLAFCELSSVRLLTLSWDCTSLSSLHWSTSSFGLDLCSVFWSASLFSMDIFLFLFLLLFGLFLPSLTFCTGAAALSELLRCFCFLTDLYSQMSSSNKVSSDMATHEIFSLLLRSSSQISLSFH